MKLEKQNPTQCIWFLDYDGSLCPHHEVWEPRNYDTREILDSLEHLAKRGDELLWNTGRRVESLASVEEKFLDYSGYFVQGSVFWNAATKVKQEFGPKISQQIVDFYDQLFEDEKNFRIEHKPTSVRIAPLHLKDLPALKSILEKNPTILSFGGKTWEWHVGHRGAELLPTEFNKGTAVKKHLGSSKKIPVAIGDDSLDRTAAEVVLERGGYFIAVGSGCGWVTEIAHRPEQLLYFDTPRDALSFIDSL